MKNTFGFRLVIWLQALGSAWSQLWQVLWAAPRWLAMGGVAPDPDETVSSVTGRMAMAGKRWARIAEWMIDRIMLPLHGWRLGHCREAALLFEWAKPKVDK